MWNKRLVVKKTGKPESILEKSVPIRQQKDKAFTERDSNKKRECESRTNRVDIKEGNYVKRHTDRIDNPEIVDQPSWRTFTGVINEDFKDILGRSLVGSTEQIEWADVI